MVLVVKGEIMAAQIPVPVSGVTANYTDPNTGMNLPTGWVQIRQINYIPSVSCLVVADVYMDQSMKQSSMSPVFTNILSPVNYGDQNWQTFFDPSVMAQAGNDIQSQAIKYLTAIIGK